jgi:hypothetical protein
MKTLRLDSLLIVAALGLFAEGEYASGQILLNGGFEAPTIYSNTFQHSTPEHWSWESSWGLIFNGDVGAPFPLAREGQQYLDLGNQSGWYILEQTFTITHQGNYELHWYDNTATTGTTSPYSVDVLTGAVLIVITTNLDAYHAGTWQFNCVDLTLSPGSYTLRFSARGVNHGLDTLIDDVSLEPQQPRLSIIQIGNAQARISWSTNFFDYSLEWTGELNTMLWDTVTNLVATTNDQLSVTVDIDTAVRLFRLHKL